MVIRFDYDNDNVLIDKDEITDKSIKISISAQMSAIESMITEIVNMFTDIKLSNYSICLERQSDGQTIYITEY